MPHASNIAPAAGKPEQLEQGITRVIAPNPSPMTYWGTNSYLVGETSVVVIDPGPADEAHLAALLGAIDGRDVAAILITHSHRDHSPLAARLRQETGAKVYAFGPSTAGRSERMNALAQSARVAGGEGVDATFAPDIELKDNEVFRWKGNEITALHTPGHFCNHLSFRYRDTLFSGDHVMGWASTLISPPDGDLAQYRNSIKKLQGQNLKRFLPGHGAPIDSPEERVAELLAHRNDREAKILVALNTIPQSIPAITRAVYTDTPKALLPAAERNTFAHLIDLYDKNTVFASNPLSFTSHFSRK
ncbi:MBL fold metallo-hydrolase [Falsihalocynthiibacter sp. SS001]|uniref:MBL fold metallo-hydrolase n=1 Tax=Falsihalocynthiibacter sp. SS001 TaxID=3349698 RepID=UPI0036D3D091